MSSQGTRKGPMVKDNGVGIVFGSGGLDRVEENNGGILEQL